MMKLIVRPESPSELDQWDLEVRGVVETLFAQISGTDRSISIVEVQRWLGKEWRARTEMADDDTPSSLDAPAATDSTLRPTGRPSRASSATRHRPASCERTFTAAPKGGGRKSKPAPKKIVRRVLDPPVHEYLSDICRLAQSGDASREQREALNARIGRFRRAVNAHEEERSQLTRRGSFL